MPVKTFPELVASGALSGATIILDVDGTLVPDGERSMDTATTSALRELGKRAQVYLCSNMSDKGRLELLAREGGVSFIDSPLRKPNPKILANVSHKNGEVVVMGDKYLTDGLLSVLGKVRFMRVARLRGVHEGLSLKITYLLDALIGRPVCFMASISI